VVIAGGCRGDGVVDEDGGDGGGGGEGAGVEGPGAGRGAVEEQRQLLAELSEVSGAGLAGGFGEPCGEGFLSWVPLGVHSLRSGWPAGRLSTQFGVLNIRAASQLRQPKEVIVVKLEGKVAVITGASAGLALAGARLFAAEGACVFITGQRQEALEEAARLTGPNVTAAQGDASGLGDLDRLFSTVKREKGAIDVL
jgi:hypothetical protein